MSETPAEATDGVAGVAPGLPDTTRVLVRDEIAAAQREMLDKAKHALPAIGLLGAAGLFGVLFVAASYRLSVRLLEKSLPPDAAALVAATGYGVAAGAAGGAGIQRLRAGRPLVQADTVRESVAAATGTAKAVAGTTAKTATDTAKAVADTAKTVADTAKTVADTAKTAAGATAKTATDKAKAAADTAKKATDTATEKAAGTAKKAAGTTAGTARSRATRQAGPPAAGTES
jgi:Putative Actinobacterial Holin-X, holin superfamily III